MDLLVKKYQSIPLSYETIEQQSAILNPIHGMFLMMCGGSWVSLAIVISFFSVYNVWDTLIVLKTQVNDPEELPVKVSLHKLWLLTVALYSVWTVPLLSKITVAFMLEKQLSGSVINHVFERFFEERFQIERIFRRWRPLLLKGATRFVLAFLSMFFHNIQVCLVMAHMGYHKLCIAISPALRKQIQVMKGPFNLDGTTLTLCACLTACTGWQLVYAYQSSFLGIIVPLGFLVHARKLPEMNIVDVTKLDQMTEKAD